MKYIGIFLLIIQLVVCQSSDFNVTLRLDFSSVDALMELSEGRMSNVRRAADLRGNRIAAATSALLARRVFSAEHFAVDLERFRSGSTPSDDIYGLRTTIKYLPQIKTLLQEIKKRQLDRRVVATIASFFPPSAKLNVTIPVYFVALGNENAAAFVRRIAWDGNTPRFVGDNEGELTIVINLTRSVQYIQDVQIQFVDMMSTLAHETFHAAFGVYQSSSTVWQQVHSRYEPEWTMAELVQNEGIAYLISAQQRTGADLTSAQLASAKRAIRELNASLKELRSPALTRSRARELIMNSNLSGTYEKNYGATAGLLMAYAIDAKLGRAALTETITNGPSDFFAKYRGLTRQFGEFPPFDDAAVDWLNQ
jgi:hypothetical protein